jgi:hypothetical protein
VAAQLTCTLLSQYQAESGHTVLPAAAIPAALLLLLLTQQMSGQ